LDVGDHVRIIRKSNYECVHRTRVRQLFPLFHQGRSFVSTGYQLCAINEIDALSRRHGMQLPEIDESVFTNLWELSKKMRPFTPEVKPLTWDELISKSPSSKRKRIQHARELYLRDGLQPQDNNVTAFIKYEKWEHHKMEEELVKPMEHNSPRLIQYRSFKYTYKLLTMLRPIEDMFWKRDRNMKWLPMHKRTFAKGMTSWQIAANLRWKWEQFKDPIAILLDYSRMDAHMREKLRENAEWRQYLRFNRTKQFRKMLEVQRVNRVSTRHGLKYIIRATMMSGEGNTAIGDSETNEVILCDTYTLEALLTICGDDAVIMMERRDYDPSSEQNFAKYGMVAKTEICLSFSDITFCQCKPLRISGGWRMVRDPFRVMSRSAYTCKQYQGKAWLKLMSAIGIGELSCNTGVPVLQEFAMMIWRSAGYGRDSIFEKDYMVRRMDKIVTKRVPVTQAARLDFALAFEISVTEQIGMETHFQTVDLPCLL